MDRSIVIRMRRKKRSEQRERDWASFAGIHTEVLVHHGKGRIAGKKLIPQRLVLSTLGFGVWPGGRSSFLAHYRRPVFRGLLPVVTKGTSFGVLNNSAPLAFTIAGHVLRLAVLNREIELTRLRRRVQRLEQRLEYLQSRTLPRILYATDIIALEAELAHLRDQAGGG